MNIDVCRGRAVPYVTWGTAIADLRRENLIMALSGGGLRVLSYTRHAKIHQSLGEANR